MKNLWPYEHFSNAMYLNDASMNIIIIILYQGGTVLHASITNGSWSQLNDKTHLWILGPDTEPWSARARDSTPQRCGSTFAGVSIFLFSVVWFKKKKDRAKFEPISRLDLINVGWKSVSPEKNPIPSFLFVSAAWLAGMWHFNWSKKSISKGMRRKMCITEQCLTESSLLPSPHPQARFPIFPFASCSLIAGHWSLWGHQVYDRWGMTAAQAFIVTGKSRGLTKQPQQNHFYAKMPCFPARRKHCGATQRESQGANLGRHVHKSWAPTLNWKRCSCWGGRLLLLTNSSD